MAETLPTIEIVPQTVTVGVNSYVTLEELETYLNDRLHFDVRLQATNDDYCKALKAGTAALDRLGFTGMVTSYEQRLAWPRCRVRDREGRLLDSNIVPDVVKHAAIEFALHLLHRLPPSAAPISRKKVADLEIEYRATVTDPVPPIVRDMLAPFLTGTGHSAELVF
jgi:hypothetical protein